MDLVSFFQSYLGMYLVQAFMHSLVAALVVDSSIVAWNIADPRLRQRLRLMVIVAPLVLYPVFQAVNPQRGSPWFRLEALFDTGRWLNLVLWDGFTLGAVFLALLCFTAVVFIFQELVPIARHSLAAKDAGGEWSAPDRGSPVAVAIEGLPGRKPALFLMDDDELMLFSKTGRDPAVVMTTGLAGALSADEIRAAVAHEMGHIDRGRRPLLAAVFVLRVLSFYNPVALMEFRRIIEEEEKICDDIAVSRTGNAAALASVLRRFQAGEDDAGPAEGRNPQGIRDRIEDYSHSLLLEHRLERLERKAGPERSEGRGVVLSMLLAVVIIAITYYIV